MLETFNQKSGGNGLDNRNWANLKMADDSMSPTIPKGSMVLAKEIAPDRYKHTKQLGIYGIVTASGTVIKRLYRLKDGSYTMVSDNETEYPQLRLYVKDIKEMWEVCCAFPESKPRACKVKLNNQGSFADPAARLAN